MEKKFKKKLLQFGFSIFISTFWFICIVSAFFKIISFLNRLLVSSSLSNNEMAFLVGLFMLIGVCLIVSWDVLKIFVREIDKYYLELVEMGVFKRWLKEKKR